MKRATGVLVALAMVVSLLVFESTAAQALDSTATSETRVFSTITSGSYLDTGASDDVYEQLRERNTGGAPSTRESRMIHEWAFEVAPNNGAVTFSIEAYRPANAEGDDFEFSYSTDGGSSWTGWQPSLVITSESEITQTVSLPDATSGTVLIRVEDTDRTAGNSTRDYLFIDEMHISTDAQPPPNQPPVALDDEASTVVNSPVSIAVLNNDSDADGGTLTIDAVSSPSNGEAVIDVNDSSVIIYTPATDFVGSDAFTYDISDGQGGSDTANVTVTITDPSLNTAPTAGDDTAATEVDTPVVISVLDNDSDPDNDPLTITEIPTPPNDGSAAITGSTVTYTPDPGFEGSDSFTYQISDGQGGTDTATVTITVTNPSQNNPPTAADDTASTGTGAGISIPVLDNDNDPDGDSLTITTVTPPTGDAGGTAVVTGNRITYTPADAGQASFSYHVSDGSSSASATVTVTVDSNPPVTVSPGDNLAQVVNNAGPGATIVLEPGVYNNQSIIPLPGQTFLGNGAVMDGKRRTAYAFQNLNNVAGVTIEGIEVRNYKPRQYHGAIDFRSTDWGDDDFGPKTDWVLRNVWSHDNNGDGIFVGDGAWLYNVRSTDNKWLGVGGHGIDLQFFGGELARNSTGLRDQQIGNHSGGMKLTKARDIVISGMHVHDNGGPGIWLDVAILNATIEKSLIADNQSPGIRYEISYDGFIRDNIFLRNGLTDPNYTNDPWVWGASIAIRTSRNVWIEDNFVADSGAGIIVIDMPHRDGAERLSVQPNMRDPQNREYASVENHIFRNTVVYTGRAGAAVGGSDPSNPRVFHMNEFDYNDYIGVEFWWENDGPPYFGRSYTWEEWQAVGNDLNTPALLTERPSTPPWSNPW